MKSYGPATLPGRASFGTPASVDAFALAGLSDAMRAEGLRMLAEMGLGRRAIAIQSGLLADEVRRLLEDRHPLVKAFPPEERSR